MSSTTKYFAYGSNMLLKRMHFNNSTSKKIGTGKLNGYKLTFSGEAKFWEGATATLIKAHDHHIWGAIYDIPNSEIQKLDEQESGYDKITVQIEEPTGEKTECFLYLIDENLLAESEPSKTYKTIIVKGAIESNLPQVYIDFLENFQDNGLDGPTEFLENVCSLKL